MITFKKITTDRYNEWLAPAIGKEFISIKEYKSDKGTFDIFVYNPSYGTDYVGTFNDISKAKREANSQYEIFEWLQKRDENALPDFPTTDTLRSQSIISN